ncbi:MAG: flagellar type III secretion system pore protein FliP [Gammaproteobacteria bacterium]|nr:flagellar type III secretion system pore protein FliP [Gammaproteobacteria bacterium]
MRYAGLWVALCLLVLPMSANAETSFLTVRTLEDGATGYSLNLRILILMTALTLIPSMLLALTSFTRIIIVLSILRQAMGTQSTPSNQILVGLALFLSLFIMAPVGERVYEAGLGPYLDEQMTEQEAWAAASIPLKEFMLGQTRETDIAMFARIADVQGIQTPMDTPMTLLIPAFITSELKTAFQIGFLIFIPFVVIDLIVASLLMSMGMMMLSPMIISLPFKLILFVLVDGWALTMGTLASSFYGVI